MTTPAHPRTAMTNPPDAPHPPPPERAAAPEPAPKVAHADQSEAGVDPAEPGVQEPPSRGPRSARVVQAERARGAAGALRAAAADNLMVAIFGPMIVLLLGYSLYTTNDRFGEINDRFIAHEASNDRRFAAQDAKIAALDTKIDDLETKIDTKIAALETKIDTRIDTLDAKIDDLALKLTALITSLERTDEVTASASSAATAGTPPPESP